MHQVFSLHECVVVNLYPQDCLLFLEGVSLVLWQGANEPTSCITLSHWYLLQISGIFNFTCSISSEWPAPGMFFSFNPMGIFLNQWILRFLIDDLPMVPALSVLDSTVWRPMIWWQSRWLPTLGDAWMPCTLQMGPPTRRPSPKKYCGSCETGRYFVKGGLWHYLTSFLEWKHSEKMVKKTQVLKADFLWFPNIEYRFCLWGLWVWVFFDLKVDPMHWFQRGSGDDDGDRTLLGGGP